MNSLPHLNRSMWIECCWPWLCHISTILCILFCHSTYCKSFEIWLPGRKRTPNVLRFSECIKLLLFTHFVSKITFHSGIVSAMTDETKNACLIIYFIIVRDAYVCPALER